MKKSLLYIFFIVLLSMVYGCSSKNDNKYIFKSQSEILEEFKTYSLEYKINGKKFIVFENEDGIYFSKENSSELLYEKLNNKSYVLDVTNETRRIDSEDDSLKTTVYLFNTQILTSHIKYINNNYSKQNDISFLNRDCDEYLFSYQNKEKNDVTSKYYIDKELGCTLKYEKATSDGTSIKYEGWEVCSISFDKESIDKKIEEYLNYQIDNDNNQFLDWNDNDFTNQIIKPLFGTFVIQSQTETECIIHYSGVNSNDFNSYINNLEQQKVNRIGLSTDEAGKIIFDSRTKDNTYEVNITLYSGRMVIKIIKL